ncbi:hypothetical protein RKLH11_1317 [Rhodobacteraceae bacterium KLH11]|nr:hypothetical protein RKLH11_1317 [Rhodobacteraceae bacterium KLH11]
MGVLQAYASNPRTAQPCLAAALSRRNSVRA